MGSNELVIHYAVDVVFCIDATGSMAPYLDSVKATARDFHRLLEREMAGQKKGIKQLRVRVVSFRDLGEEGPDAIEGTQFFVLPDQAAAFDGCLAGLEAQGGGDEPESALEALAVAFRSNWERGLDKRRHVVVMCTDASAHPLGKFSMPSPTVQGRPMPRSLEELMAIWGDEDDDGEMEYSAKRLVVFAPNAYPWNSFNDRFENCAWVESAAGEGMKDADQSEVLKAIAGSV